MPTKNPKPHTNAHPKAKRRQRRNPPEGEGPEFEALVIRALEEEFGPFMAPDEAHRWIHDSIRDLKRRGHE